jgi:hypothetical protein
MTRQNRANETFKSIAGGSLVGLGLHILWGNLEGVAAQLSPFLGTTGEEPGGGMSSVILAASQAVQAYAYNHQGFLQGLLQVSVSLWPLLLVIIGTILSRDVFSDEVKALPAAKKYFQKKDATCRFRFLSFDV